MEDQVDSLEDWVSIKDNPFLDKTSNTSVNFILAWNDVENKIVITCRERVPQNILIAEEPPKAWSGDFSFIELSSIHQQLSLVHPSLDDYLPSLPYQPSGVWAYLYDPQEVDEERLCNQISEYLRIAESICGQALLIETLFEEHSYEEYFENISELKRKSFTDAVGQAEDQLQNVLFLRDGAINMLDMCEVYKQEDEALFKLNIALAELYNYQIQPFLDMREVACSKLREAKCGLQNPNFGERRKEEFRLMFIEWQEHYIHALDQIQELYIDYYNRTVQLQHDVMRRMLRDQKTYGKTSFSVVASERLQRVIEDESLERLQLLINTKKHYENQRDKVKQEIVCLEEKPNGIGTEISQLEKEVYDWQIQIYDAQMDYTSEEERLLKHQKSTVLTELSSKHDEVTFYDAVEDVDDLSSEEDSKSKFVDPRLKNIASKLSKLYKDRALIRNKKKALIDKRNEEKTRKKAAESSFKQHHKVQIKRDEKREDIDKKSDFYTEERKKTLARLRQYKLKYPTPSRIRARRSPRPQLKGKEKELHEPINSEDEVDNNTATINVPKAATENDLSSQSPSTGAPPPPPPPPVPPPPLILPSNMGTNVPLSQTIPPPPPPPPPPPKLPSSNLSRSESRESSKIHNTKLKMKRNAVSKNSTLNGDPMSDMLKLIREGVKLKPAEKNVVAQKPKLPSEEHTKQLQEALERINRHTQDSEDSDCDEQDFDD